MAERSTSARVDPSGWLAAAVRVMSAAPAGARRSGQIAGAVTDASRAVLPGVTITVVNERLASADGHDRHERAYVITNLPVGSYSVERRCRVSRPRDRRALTSPLMAD
jgi:hypothetical protein